MTNQNDEIIRMVSEFIDETISNEERTKLVSLLKIDVNARNIYLEMIQTDSTMSWCATTNLIEIPSQEGTVTKTKLVTSSLRRQLITLRFSLAGMLLLCGFLLVALYLKDGATTVIAAERVAPSEGGAVAVITHTENAEWIKTNLSTIPGKPLHSGWLKLKKGRAYIDFLDGTKVLLEGPAELGLNGNSHTFLRLGKLTVLSSKKTKFTVETEKLKAISSDAQIGFLVTKENKTEVHIFSVEAEVRLTQNHRQILLTATEAVVVSGKEKAVLTTQKAEREKFHSVLEKETVKQQQEVKPLLFEQSKMLPYGYQDGQYSLPTKIEFMDNQTTIRLSGNSWKMMEVNKTLTKDTVIEFEYRTSHEGQIHGFGFDNDDHYNILKGDILFQIHGYEVRPGIGQQFNNYDGTEWRKYRIRVGRYVSGHRRYLFFAADDDVTGKAESFFRNVKLFEAPPAQKTSH